MTYRQISILLENDRFVLCVDFKRVTSWDRDDFALIVHKLNKLSESEFNNVQFIFPDGKWLETEE